MSTIKEIYLAAQTALMGEVYPAIREIVVKYDPIKKEIVLRYYLDREPKEADYESVSAVMTEIISYFNIGRYFESIKEECIYSQEPGNKLDPLDGIVYARREYDLDEVS